MLKIKKGIMVTTLGATMGFGVGCQGPAGSPLAPQGTSPQATQSKAATADIVTISMLRVGSDGKSQLTPVARVTRSEFEAMKAERAARQAGAETGGVAAQARTKSLQAVSEDCIAVGLWLFDGEDQQAQTDMICVNNGTTEQLIGCPSEEPVSPLYQVRSFWGGSHSFRLWGQFWTPGCFSNGEYTLRNGQPWERRDTPLQGQFGPTFPSFATAN